MLLQERIRNLPPWTWILVAKLKEIASNYYLFDFRIYQGGKLLMYLPIDEQEWKRPDALYSHASWTIPSRQRRNRKAFLHGLGLESRSLCIVQRIHDTELEYLIANLAW